MFSNLIFLAVEKLVWRGFSKCIGYIYLEFDRREHVLYKAFFWFHGPEITQLLVILYFETPLNIKIHSHFLQNDALYRFQTSPSNLMLQKIQWSRFLRSNPIPEHSPPVAWKPLWNYFITMQKLKNGPFPSRKWAIWVSRIWLDV